MAENRDHRFLTERLIVDEWHSFSPDEWPDQDLAAVIQETLTERVTQSLPPPWQGLYSRSRALQWISERDHEGTTLLVLNKMTRQAIGLVVLFEPDGSKSLRLGYMLNESAWGKGFASELIKGFVDWCRHHSIRSITGGVERNNPASRRVLEKCGFELDTSTVDSDEQLFSLKLI